MGLFDSFLGKERSFSDLKKYVDDFEITEEKDAGGKVRKTAKYKGQWTVLRETTAAVMSRIWLTAGLSALILAAYIRMLLLTHMAGGELYSNINGIKSHNVRGRMYGALFSVGGALLLGSIVVTGTYFDLVKKSRVGADKNEVRVK